MTNKCMYLFMFMHLSVQICMNYMCTDFLNKKPKVCIKYNYICLQIFCYYNYLVQLCKIILFLTGTTYC